MNVTRELCEELNIFLVFNESYSPATNPIESVFSILKRHYQKEKLNRLAKQLSFDMKK